MPLQQSLMSASKVSIVGIIKFVIKHWYIFSILFFLIPGIIGSFQVAIKTNNPTYPFIELGLSLTNADASINNVVNDLRTDETKYIRPLPEDGSISKKILHYWDWTKLIWKLLGYLFLITIPFVLAYRYFKWKGKDGVESSTQKNITDSLKLGLTFIFIINLILTIIYLIDGTIFLTTPDSDIFVKALYVVFQTIPFHGVFNLIGYLIGF